MTHARTAPARRGAFPARMLALALLAGAATPLAAAAEAQPAEESHGLALQVSRAQLVRLPEAAKTVFVANPDIADVQAPDPKSFLIFGKSVGSTTVYVLSRSGKILSYAVTVGRQTGPIAAAIREQAPGASVQVSGAPGGVTVSGTVASPREAEAVKSAVQPFLGEKDSLNLKVGVQGSAQVNLQVRVAEVSRQVSRSFGFNWDAVSNNGSVAIGFLSGRAPVSSFGHFIRDTSQNGLSSIGLGYQSPGGSVNVSTLIDALQAEGLVTILAQPNLTAISGESASFLAGGEFPVPVAQGLEQISIEWKSFGVSVDFTPVVLDGDRISIKVRPEVSELSDTGAVTIANIKIPSIAVRRAQTTVELASGQSFAIAGLYQNNASNSVDQYPWLGDLPVLGTLFRSSSFKRNESELVIIVTPYIVRPAARPADLRLPTDGVVFASDLDQVLLGRVTAPKGQGAAPAAPAATPHLRGPAGFMLENGG